jgi:hypothetical protein
MMYRVSTDVDSGIPRKSECFRNKWNFVCKILRNSEGKNTRYSKYIPKLLYTEINPEEVPVLCIGGVSPLWCCNNVQGRAVNCGLKWFFQYRPACLNEPYGGPKKQWLLCVGLLAADLFNEVAFFFATAGRMSGRSCGCIMLQTGPIQQQ